MRKAAKIGIIVVSSIAALFISAGVNSAVKGPAAITLAYAQESNEGPVISIQEERSSCNPDPDVTFADFALYMRVDNIPLGTQGWAIVTMESSDGVETLLYRGWSIGQVEQGWIAGGIETIVDVGKEPYTLTFYEAVGPDPDSTEPYDPETDIFPKPGGATTSLTVTCEDLDAELTPPDTKAPVITVPEDITEEATSSEGAEVSFEVSAEDDVEGNATLEEDGTTITQDDVGGDINISCEPTSGSVFPIGATEVECSATDEAGNIGETASFTVTVNPLPPSTTPAEAIDELISTVQNLDQVPQSVKTSLNAPLKQASDILSDDNPNNDKAACGKLGAFISHLSAAERHDRLTPNQADALRTQAEDIMSRLDC